MPIPDFKEILDNLPDKPPRSRLEPYRDLILEMRRRGRSLREIVQVLGEKCGVRVVPSTLHDFLTAALSQERDSQPNSVGRSRARNTVQPERKAGREASPDEVDRRIAALKTKETPPQTTPKLFQFVSGEPLKLPRRPKTGDRMD